MKFQPKRFLAALLAGLMLLSGTACAKGDDPAETKDPSATEAGTEANAACLVFQ